MISLGFQSSVLQPLPKTLTVCKPLQAAQIRVEGQGVCLSSTDLHVQLCPQPLIQIQWWEKYSDPFL